MNYSENAYKPAEKLFSAYTTIRSVLNAVLRLQKFPTEIENALYALYQNFQKNLDPLIKKYQQIPGVLPISKYSEDEVSALLEESDLTEPLREEAHAVKGLVELLRLINSSILDQAKSHVDAIPEFNWDIETFKQAFQDIIEKGENYAKHVGNR